MSFNFKIIDLMNVFNFISDFFNSYYGYYRDERDMYDVDRYLSFEKECKVYIPDNASEAYFKSIFGSYIPEDHCSKVYEYRYCRCVDRVVRSFGLEAENVETREHIFYKKKIFIIISEANTFRLAARKPIFSDMTEEIYITIPANFSELSEGQKYSRCNDIFAYIISENVGIRSVNSGIISKTLAGLIFESNDKEIDYIVNMIKRDVAHIIKDNHYALDISRQFIFEKILRPYSYV